MPSSVCDRVAVTSLALAILVTGCGRLRSWDSSPRKARSFAPLEERFTEIRFSGTQHDECFRQDRGFCLAVSTAAHRIRDVLGELDEDSKTAWANDPRALARVHILRRKLDPAIALLREATNSNAEILNDLGASYWLRFLEKRAPRDLMAALRAFREAETLPEALFNRAKILGELGLERSALKAWSAFIVREPDSLWAEEARLLAHRLREKRSPSWSEITPLWEKALERSDAKMLEDIVIGHAERTLFYFETKVLMRWAQATLSGNTTEASRELSRARMISDAYERGLGDGLPRDVLDSLPTEPVSREELARGFLALGRGLVFLEQGHFKDALPYLKVARTHLRQTQNPYALRARLDELRSLYKMQDYRAVVRGANEVLEEVGEASYIDLRARTLWILGSAALNLGRTTQALDAYHRAIELYRSSTDRQRRGILHLLTASAYGEIGDLETAWSHRLEALTLLAGREGDPWLLLAIQEASYGALQLGEAETALAMHEEAVALTTEKGPLQTAIAFLHRAEILRRLARHDEVEDSLVVASRNVEKISEPRLREDLRGDLRLAQARSLLEVDPATVLPLLDGILKSYREHQVETRIPTVLHWRGKARLAAGDAAGAERDFRAAVASLEQLRALRLTDEDRWLYLDGFTALYEDLMRLLLDERGQISMALEIGEKSRARLLLDRLNATEARRTAHPTTGGSEGLAAAPSKSLAEILPHLEDNPQVLVYQILIDRLLVAVLGPAGPVALESVPITSDDLASLVERAFEEEAGFDFAPSTPLEDLYDVLIRPIETHLEPHRVVAIVPETFLYQVPFSGLRNRRTGRSLIEDQVLVFYPSLNVIAALEERAPTMGAGALVVADPAFDQELFPLLGRLPGAASVAAKLAKLFPGTTLRAKEATSREVLARIKGHSLVHFGAHSEARATFPLRSRLLLAPDERNAGVLEAGDLLSASWASVELVVLAACDSVGSRSLGSEGVAGLVWPLLAAGVPRVIATLRPVEDAEVESLMTDFYHFLAESGDPLHSLRRAQLAALKEAPYSTVRAWSNFQLYGVPSRLPRGEP